MSNWINWRIAICRTRDLSTTAKGLALYLNTYMNDRHDMAWPGIATICGEMNMARATAIKYLNELTENGFLVSQKRFGQTTVRHATIPSSSNRELVQELNHSSSNLSTSVVQTTDPNKQENKQWNKQVIGKKVSSKFKPPTIEDVAAYCIERENRIDAESFVDHYEANGWMRGKTKIKDWKACVRTWEKNIESSSGNRINGTARNKNAAERMHETLKAIAAEDVDSGPFF